MSVRDFAAYLGVNDAAVSSWERRGDKAQLRYETQQILDSALANAPRDVQERFFLLLGLDPKPDRDDETETATALASSAPGGLTSLGSRSSERTKVLLSSARDSTALHVRRHLDTEALRAVRSFTASVARTFVLKGPPGSGKTQFTHDAASELVGSVDFQLHSVDTWDFTGLDLAAEILRYASLPAGDDPLLTLERAGEALTRQCLVVIDGINAEERLDPIGRQLDAIVRQVTSGELRFMLVIRTPPEGDLTAFPVLAASVFDAPGEPSGTSHLTAPWDLATARDMWNSALDGEGEPAFDDLPASLQALARLPLYMNLIKAAGGAHAPGQLNAYRLVDHCVTNILGAGRRDSARIARELAELAYAESSQLVPAQLVPATVHDGASGWITERLPAISPLAHLTDAGRPVFAHDIIREYFLAKRIAGLVAERGRSTVTVAALNQMATQAMSSATARGIFEFVVFALDDQSPDLATSVALAPTLAVETTLPMMLGLAVSGTRFATEEVLRISAKRCADDTGIELARSLLKHAGLSQALGDGYEVWLLGLLRQFGSAIWQDVSAHIEDRFEFEVTTRFLTQLNLDTAEEATFLARYYFLFIESESAHDELLEDLAVHMDWRVRMALAQGLLQGSHASAILVRQITDRLARDADYKVRAAVARALGYNGQAVVRSSLTELLADPNWHVRASVLDGTYVRQLTTPDAAITGDALDIVRGDPSWQTCPGYIAKLVERLRLLEAASDKSRNGEAREHALFGLLRELSTGWINVPARTRDALVSEGLQSASWLAQREAKALRDRDHPAGSQPGAAVSLRQNFRRLRDSRSIQVALDLRDLDHAIEVATAAEEAGADLIEIGDPLIKAVGMRAVDQIKRRAPKTTVVAEMMSADWGRDQVELAAEAGADVVLLIGPGTTASVSAAVDAGRRLGVAIMLDIPAAQTTQAWVREMERAGVDGFTITTNIDLGVGVHPPLTKARAVRGWTRLPVAVSGGFSATDYAIIDSADWDIMIVGRSIAEAVHPAQAAREIVKLVHQRRVRPSNDRHTA